MTCSQVFKIKYLSFPSKVRLENTQKIGAKKAARGIVWYTRWLLCVLILREHRIFDHLIRCKARMTDHTTRRVFIASREVIIRKKTVNSSNKLHKLEGVLLPCWNYGALRSGWLSAYHQINLITTVTSEVEEEPYSSSRLQHQVLWEYHCNKPSSHWKKCIILPHPTKPVHFWLRFED